MATVTQKIGKVTQVIGSTFDAQFPEDQLPSIYNAVKVVSQHKGIDMNLTGEVQQHLGGGRVRRATGKHGRYGSRSVVRRHGLARVGTRG